MHERGEEEDRRVYCVLVNDEEEHSLWLAASDDPPGWRRVGPTGPKDECLEYVERAWTDMRPLSLRR